MNDLRALTSRINKMTEQLKTLSGDSAKKLTKSLDGLLSEKIKLVSSKIKAITEQLKVARNNYKRTMNLTQQFFHLQTILRSARNKQKKLQHDLTTMLANKANK